MEVKLIDYTTDAAAKLIFTKSTRLNMTPDFWEETLRRANEDMVWRDEELVYMTKTIPSSWEFVNFTFLISGVSRAFTHQFVRTRHGSYAQQTMRMVNMDQFTYVTGPTIKADAEAKFIYDECMGAISEAYAKLIARGIPPEDARGILPTNICTNIVGSFNLRTLSEMCKSRTGGRTQDEYRLVVNAMADAVLAVYSWAEMFLFPAGRAAFDNLERMAEHIKLQDPKLGYEVLKDIDTLRKGAA